MREGSIGSQSDQVPDLLRQAAWRQGGEYPNKGRHGCTGNRELYKFAEHLV